MSKNDKNSRLRAGLYKLTKDERIHPNQRLLALLTIAHLDGNPWALDILKKQFGSSSAPMKVEEKRDTVNQEGRAQLKKYFNDLEESNADTADNSEGS